MTFLSYVLGLVIDILMQPTVRDVASDVAAYAIKRASEQMINSVERGRPHRRSDVQNVK